MNELSKLIATGRVCKKCQTYKTWDCFDKKGDGFNGYHSQCKVCIKQFKRKWWKKKNMKPIQRPTVFDFSNSNITELFVSFTQSEKLELEKILRSMVFDTFCKKRG